jgi:hypothetical protein
MKRQTSSPHTFDDRISEYRVNIEAQLEAAQTMADKQRFQRMLRQIETAATINDWITSPNLKAPK